MGECYNYKMAILPSWWKWLHHKGDCITKVTSSPSWLHRQGDCITQVTALQRWQESRLQLLW